MSENESCSTATKEEESVFAVGSSDFNDVVETKAFVDKTLLIKKVILNGQFEIKINAPPRFGKSTNMDMLKKFVEIQVDECGAVINREESSNYEIFKGHNLLVYQDRHFFNKYFATYPVLYVDFKYVSGNSYNEILDSFQFSMHETFKLHPYLLQSDKLDSAERKVCQKYCGEKSYVNTHVPHSLPFLSYCLYKHFNNKKVFLLIDAYDAPANNMLEVDDLVKVNGLLDDILFNVLKRNKCVERAFLTGVSCFIIGMSPFKNLTRYGFLEMSALNNLSRYRFLDDHQFMKFYGLTEPEVGALLDKFNIDEEMKMKVKSYYNGYCSVDSEKLFSICSVLHYLQNRELKSYWEPCDMVNKFKNALTFFDIRASIEILCSGYSLRIFVYRYLDFNQVDRLQEMCLGVGAGSSICVDSYLFLFFLLERGYLTYETVINTHLGIYAVKIPNSEIFDELQEQLKEYYGPSVNSRFDACADIFKEISSSSEDGIFQDSISKFILLLKELHFKAIKKSKYTGRYLLFNILCKAKYSIGAELLVAKGKTCLIFYKDCLGIIIEVKYDQTADVALRDIAEKYVNVFEEELCLKNVTEKIYMGLNVNKNDTANMKLLVNCVDLTEAKTF